MKRLTFLGLSTVLSCMLIGSVSAGTLVSAYTFDETTGATASDAIRGPSGDATAVGGVQWVAGTIGGGVQLDGVDGWLSAANPIANGATAMSFSGWVNAESLPVWSSVVKNWAAPKLASITLAFKRVTEISATSCLTRMESSATFAKASSFRPTSGSMSRLPMTERRTSCSRTARQNRRSRIYWSLELSGISTT